MARDSEGEDSESTSCTCALKIHSKLIERNSWWMLPWLSFLGLADLVIAVLDFTPGLPVLFEVLHVVLEMISFMLLCLLFIPVFHFFPRTQIYPDKIRMRIILVVWLLSIPMNLSIVLKSLVAVILQIRGHNNEMLDLMAIILSALMLFYDFALCFIDFPSYFDRQVDPARNAKLHRERALGSIRSSFWCFGAEESDNETADAYSEANRSFDNMLAAEEGSMSHSSIDSLRSHDLYHFRHKLQADIRSEIPIEMVVDEWGSVVHLASEDRERGNQSELSRVPSHLGRLISIYQNSVVRRDNPEVERHEEANTPPV